jgi:hypothetical protein
MQQGKTEKKCQDEITTQMQKLEETGKYRHQFGTNSAVAYRII